MYAVEFEAEIRDGVVKIPAQYSRLKNGHARIVVLIGEDEAEKQMGSLSFGECEINAFRDKDGVQVQRELRDAW